MESDHIVTDMSDRVTNRNNSLAIPSHHSSHSTQSLALSPASTSTTTSEVSSSGKYSPRALYADTFERPITSRSLPAVQRRVEMAPIHTANMTTTEKEFEALPIAVRRKVRPVNFKSIL